MSNLDRFRLNFVRSIECLQTFADTQCPALLNIAGLITEQLRKGHKILLFGNGGSAADAQHIAAELVNRLCLDRPAIPAIALTTDTSVLTSIANDFSFDRIFSRQIEALGASGDVAFAISTSGNSPNVILGVEAAYRKNMKVVAFLGSTGGKLKELVPHAILAPSSSAQHVQEVHITAAHTLCDYIERSLFGS